MSGEAEGAAFPDYVPPGLRCPWDHYRDPALVRDPIGCYDDLRSRYRVFFSQLYDGFWVFTRYDDILRTLQNPELWSSMYTSIPARTNQLLPINLDPPDHARYRRLLNLAFSPRSALALEAEMRAVTCELLDELDGSSEFDFIDAFAKPFPSAIFTSLLGLPVDEWRRLMDWNNEIIHTGDVTARQRATAEVTEYLAQLIGARRERRRGDLLSELLDAEIDGHRLSQDELLSFAVLLFMAGLDTVTAALGFIFAYLADHPGDRALIVAEPDLIPGAVEELLRLHSMVQTSRTATADCEIAGARVRQGDRVLLPLATAGRDPLAFPNVDRADFRRQPNRHLAFGAGPHRCLGSHLARVELRVALEEWHRRYPDYRPVPGVRSAHGGGVAGLDSLRLTVASA